MFEETVIFLIIFGVGFILGFIGGGRHAFWKHSKPAPTIFNKHYFKCPECQDDMTCIFPYCLHDERNNIHNIYGENKNGN